MRIGRVLLPLVLIYLVYSAALATFSHTGFPAGMRSDLRFPYLADKPVGEDGYYMLTVAWNVAAGRGIVYNLEQPTVGVQPLATGVYAVLARAVQAGGGDRWLFVRAVLLLGCLTLLLFGHLVGGLARELAGPASRDLAYALGFVGVVFHFSLFRWFTYGLETGLYLVLLTLCVRHSIRATRVGGWGTREALVLGLLGGATAWARIDFGVVMFFFLAVSVLQRQIRPDRALAAGAIAALLIAPWLLYCHAVGGNWMPSSGAAQVALVTRQSAAPRLWMMGNAVLSHLTPWIYSNLGGLFLLAAMLSLVGFLAFLLGRRDMAGFLLARFRQQPALSAWLSGMAALLPVYVVCFWPWHFYQRYSAPIVIPLAALLAAAFAERIRTAARTTQVALLCALPACFFVWAFLSLHTGRIGNSHTVAAGFIQSRFPAARVGAFQSGVIGYFNPNVINLDGKISHMALDRIRDGTLPAYIDEQRIDVLIDWPDYLRRALDAGWLAENWIPCAAPVPNDASVCLLRKVRRGE